MAERKIYLSAFPYTDGNGVGRWAQRGENVDLIEADIARGERLGAFEPLDGPETLAADGTGDVPACAKVRQFGRIAQLDLAEHVGEASTWGNRTVEMFGWDTAPALEILRGAA